MNTPRRGRLLIAVALTVLTCLFGAGPASAHDSLMGSTPEDGAVVSTAPDSVVLEFYDTIAQISPAMVLRDDNGAVVEQLHPQLDERTMTGVLPTGLPNGTYSVAWRIVSGDGHPVQGVTTFAIGTPSVPIDGTGAESSSSLRAADAGASTWTAVAIAAVPAVVVIALLVLRRRTNQSPTT